MKKDQLEQHDLHVKFPKRLWERVKKQAKKMNVTPTTYLVKSVEVNLQFSEEKK